jgi:hypothetical protein
VVHNFRQDSETEQDEDCDASNSDNGCVSDDESASVRKKQEGMARQPREIRIQTCLLVRYRSLEPDSQGLPRCIVQGPPRR